MRTGKWYLLAGIYIMVMPSKWINRLLPIQIQEDTQQNTQRGSLTNIIIEDTEFVLKALKIHKTTLNNDTNKNPKH